MGRNLLSTALLTICIALFIVAGCEFYTAATLPLDLPRAVQVNPSRRPPQRAGAPIELPPAVRKVIDETKAEHAAHVRGSTLLGVLSLVGALILLFAGAKLRTALPPAPAAEAPAGSPPATEEPEQPSEEAAAAEEETTTQS